MKPELPKFPTMLRKMWSGAEVQQWIDENVAPLFEQTVGPDQPCAHKWGIEFSTHNHEPARTVCVKCGYKPDTHALNTACEPVKVPSEMSPGNRYTVEPHGNGYAIYQGRGKFHHGLNLAHLTECTPEFAGRIESALNAMSEPIRVPSDDEILKVWSLTNEDCPLTHEEAARIYLFANALLVNYSELNSKCSEHFAKCSEVKS